MGFAYFDVEKEFEKNKELRRQDLDNLKEWLKFQPHLPKIPDPQLILFLHSCYYNNEITKQVIDNFFTIRSHTPEIFSERDLDALMKYADVSAMSPLPTLTNDGYVVVYSKFLDTNPDHWDFTNFLKKMDMGCMLWLNSEGTNMGYVVVLDMVGISFGHVTRIGLLQLKQYLTYLQEAMPVRLKGLHFVNTMPSVNKLVAMMRPFMKKELLSLLHLHTDNFETLYPFVPKKCLPKEYGGDAPTVLEMHEDLISEYLKEYILERLDFFDLESRQVLDESKRPGKPREWGKIFGIDGTFKKLNID